MGRILLVTGGARSGKSTFAEELVRTSGKTVAYIATAQVFDSEMRHRIAIHKARRPASWRTFEAPFQAEAALRQAVQDAGVVLFDCITVYLSNLVCAKSVAELADEDALYREVGESVASLADAALASDATVVFVTNEVGAGIVPENHLARIYRDLAGCANQQLASAAEEVYAVICGIPLRIK